jgi:two-component sensor histidine kinase
VVRGPEVELEISWMVEQQPGPRPTLSWRETGIAIPSRPGPAGFGTALIAARISQPLGVQARIRFHSDGVEAIIAWPLPG